MFYLDTYIVFAFYSFEKFSLIHDRHTSVSRFYTKFQLIFYTKPNFRCLLICFQNKNSNSIHLLMVLMTTIGCFINFFNLWIFLRPVFINK